MLDELFPARLTQGTIFSCAVSDPYPNPVHGLIITARCDVEHEKNDTFAYLPLVTLEDWATFDGAIITAKRAAANSLATMEDILDKVELARSLLTTIRHEDICEYLGTLNGKEAERRRDRFAKAMDSFHACNAAIKLPERRSLAELLRSHSSTFKSVFRDLHMSAISDFHYIPRIERGALATGYVVRLREVRHLSRATANLVESGFDATEHTSLSAAEAMVSAQLRFSQQADFAMPVSQIRSPDIELVMQRFTQLFARIGTEDLSAYDLDLVRTNLAATLEISL